MQPASRPGRLELLDVGQQALLLAAAVCASARAASRRSISPRSCPTSVESVSTASGVSALVSASSGTSSTGLRLSSAPASVSSASSTATTSSGSVSMASGTASGSAESASVPSSLGSGAGCAGGATAVAASRSFGRPPLVSSASVSSSFGGTPSAKPYSVLSAPPLCMASACATAAPDAKPSSTMIWPSGRFDCCCTSSTVASCSSLMSPSSVISSPSWRCGMRSLSEEALMPDSRPAAGESRRLYRR